MFRAGRLIFRLPEIHHWNHARLAWTGYARIASRSPGASEFPSQAIGQRLGDSNQAGLRGLLNKCVQLFTSEHGGK